MTHYDAIVSEIISYLKPLNESEQRDYLSRPYVHEKIEKIVFDLCCTMQLPHYITRSGYREMIEGQGLYHDMNSVMNSYGIKMEDRDYHHYAIVSEIIFYLEPLNESEQREYLSRPYVQDGINHIVERMISERKCELLTPPQGAYQEMMENEGLYLDMDSMMKAQEETTQKF